MKIYLSGPMSGHHDFNFPAFNRAAAFLRARGDDEVVNPAETDSGDTTQPWEYYLRKDLRDLLGCQAIAMLPGWRESRGAVLEQMVAESVGMKVLDATTGVALAQESICAEADRLVSGDRQGAYGHPYEDFTRTAQLWSVILETQVSASQIGMCMIALKLSRLCHAHKRDSLVDIAGYAKTLELVESYIPPPAPQI